MQIHDENRCKHITTQHSSGGNNEMKSKAEYRVAMKDMSITNEWDSKSRHGDKIETTDRIWIKIQQRTNPLNSLEKNFKNKECLIVPQ